VKRTRSAATLCSTIFGQTAVGTVAIVQTRRDRERDWLLDLPLLDKTYAEWSRETLAAGRQTSMRA
jgi:predicted YcjX-like family ATPase